MRSKINWIAESLHDFPEFSRRAEKIAEAMTRAEIDAIRAELHSEHTPPPDLKARFPGLGQWMAARQGAIFEILFHVGRPALPVLKRTAFGEYDWPQGYSIVSLVRLAAAGIDRETIVLELKESIGDMREETLMRVSSLLRFFGTRDGQVQKIFEDLLTIPAFAEADHFARQ
jgi:hypothetical protein